MITAGQQQQLRDEGFCVFPSVLSADELARARAALDRGVAQTLLEKGATHDARLDPNTANIRVYDLPARDPEFIALLMRDDALAAAEAVLGPNFLVSNFTANIALPGSLSMKLHSDQALVVPGPWQAPWAFNAIWCLDDVDEDNGATRYLPGSHRFQTAADVPADAMAQTRAFSAPAGSFIAMEGRLWHTSGANVSKDRRRRMMFAYYASDFLRAQANWPFVLPQAVQDSLLDRQRALFGLTAYGNVRIGGAFTRLEPAGAR